MIRPTILACLLTGCATIDCASYIGIAAHPVNIDSPDHYGPNPIGQIGGECRRDAFAIWAEHESAIFYRERGAGWNLVGARLWFE